VVMGVKGDQEYKAARGQRGVMYGNKQLPCELGSGGGTSTGLGYTAGGGVIGKPSIL
jgi:hypothetical protein